MTLYEFFHSFQVYPNDIKGNKCVACDYPENSPDWRDYQCPRCYCPQQFWFDAWIPFKFIKYWRLKRMYRKKCLGRT